MGSGSSLPGRARDAAAAYKVDAPALKRSRVEQSPGEQDFRGFKARSPTEKRGLVQALKARVQKKPKPRQVEAREPSDPPTPRASWQLVALDEWEQKSEDGVTEAPAAPTPTAAHASKSYRDRARSEKAAKKALVCNVPVRVPRPPSRPTDPSAPAPPGAPGVPTPAPPAPDAPKPPSGGGGVPLPPMSYPASKPLRRRGPGGPGPPIAQAPEAAADQRTPIEEMVMAYWMDQQQQDEAGTPATSATCSGETETDSVPSSRSDGAKSVDAAYCQPCTAAGAKSVDAGGCGHGCSHAHGCGHRRAQVPPPNMPAPAWNTS